MTRWRVVPSIAFLVALLALAQLQAGLALFGVIWRTAVLSWDDPDTQLVEDLASQAASVTDPSRLAHDHVLAAIGAARAGLPPDVTLPQRPALTGRITRSPPLA